MVNAPVPDRLKAYRTIRRAVFGYANHGCPVVLVMVSPRLYNLLRVGEVCGVPVKVEPSLRGGQWCAQTRRPPQLEDASDRAIMEWGVRATGLTAKEN